jgi:hypothetical protein
MFLNIEILTVSVKNTLFYMICISASRAVQIVPRGTI